MDNTLPLADQLRPQTIAEFVGQEHLLSEGKPLRNLLEQKRLISMILWGPPGCGKTTLAKMMAAAVDAQFTYLSAVSAGKKDVKEIVDKALKQKKEVEKYPGENKNIAGLYKGGTVLFLDEIHRFNKLQQDYLLPYVENGTLILIGATTENPSFEVISALLSRCRVYVLKALTTENLHSIINRGLEVIHGEMPEDAKQFLAEFSNGDARIALGVLQIAHETLAADKKSSITITFDYLKEILQKKTLLYDKYADQHYDTISAFIKSMRASNIDAALYYLARMIESGEDPKFIARRMVIFASEDIGLAQPTALVVANEVFKAVQEVGLPEAQINLAHGAAYLCLCKKDRSAYNAYFEALEDVRRFGNLSIPLNLRNAPTKLMKDLGYGKNYVAYSKESLLPDKLKGKKYYK